MAALCLQRRTLLAVSALSHRSLKCYRYGCKGLCYLQPRRCYADQTNGITSVEKLLNDVTEYRQDETKVLQCLSELVKQAREQKRISEVQNDQRFVDHLKTIAREADTLSSSALVSYLRIYSSFYFLSLEHIQPLVSVLERRLPNLRLRTSSKIAQQLLRIKAGKKLAKPFLNHSAELFMEDKQLNLNSFLRNLDVLLNSDTWSNPKEMNQLREFIVANMSTLNLRTLAHVMTALAKRNALSLELLDGAASAVIGILSRSTPVHSRVEEWGENYPLELCLLLQVFAKNKFYNEEFCNLLTQTVLSEDDSYLLSPRFLSTLAWCFGKLSYYNHSLMDLIAHCAMKDLKNFSSISLGNLVYGFGQLNHPHPELLHRVVESMFENPEKLKEPLLCWTVIWSAMVMDLCPERLFELAVTDEFIELSMQRLEGFKPILLLPFSIAVNREHPELSVATCKSPSSPFVRPRSWGTCIAGFKGLDSSHMKVATRDRTLLHSSAGHSAFGANVTRALKLALGGVSYFNEEPLSLSGYSFDFEVLLNHRNRPITIPIQWKYRNVRTLLKSIGVTDPPSGPKFVDTHYSDLLNVQGDVHPSHIQSSRDPYHKGILYQIASDWGPRFNDTKEPVARKVAIEADGRFHYARNCLHKLGKTTLKHRQLKALGWEVLSIPQHEWMQLKTGDDHALYLAKKLNINN